MKVERMKAVAQLSVLVIAFSIAVMVMQQNAIGVPVA